MAVSPESARVLSPQSAVLNLWIQSSNSPPTRDYRSGLTGRESSYILISGYTDAISPPPSPVRADDRARRFHPEPDAAPSREARAHRQRDPVGAAASPVDRQPPPQGSLRPGLGRVAAGRNEPPVSHGRETRAIEQKMWNVVREQVAAHPRMQLRMLVAYRRFSRIAAASRRNSSRLLPASGIACASSSSAIARTSSASSALR